ncbi:MAG: hypothetical protein UX80_C0004G0028 [Candidatus Amesbacteria bacterium GW2011_GWA2_47_11b]|uniref:Uncharacterized protein n=3 Tax=Candidatus Amesiibacteriota TaxID=1752730 RepID=A0A0G1VFW9_9BACT|nr:MAG: hypothetical protein UX42_C0001G0003 [Microgenomates group bacterium GW2011_GWC1_46_20]KKU58277.1 MAG: hypothetical protein UX80_C0004G0028 [Candidatus Amesbacteria bacterium GW2011_GWA2_47_11b]KKU68915.1 MAG: hypothetical protein UX92_C0017G0022 [Candidatus Amesbacteria bacterium GW2011_GWA1_47_20]KKU83584.1 MAG: hypothetical protein UY11_C0016G0004 [Candidatus Amesbacteria bacterium GW2011_GWC2_47_8]
MGLPERTRKNVVEIACQLFMMGLVVDAILFVVAPWTWQDIFKKLN